MNVAQHRTLNLLEMLWDWIFVCLGILGRGISWRSCTVLSVKFGDGRQPQVIMSKGQTCLEEANPASGLNSFAAIVVVSQNISARSVQSQRAISLLWGHFQSARWGS